MARRRWFRWTALLVILLAMAMVVAEAARIRERSEVVSVFGKAPWSNAVAAPSEPARTTNSLTARIEAWNETAPSSKFRSSSAWVSSDDEAPAVAGSDGRFFIAFSTAPYSQRLAVSPAIYDGMLLVGGRSEGEAVRFYGFDAHEGTARWVVRLQDNNAYAPACDDGVCAFTSESCSLYVVDAKTGRPKWGKWLADPLQSAPVIADGTVFAAYPSARGRSHATVGAFDLRSGRSLWQRRTTDDPRTSLVLVDGTLWSAGGNSVVGFDPRTGGVVSARSGANEGYAVGLGGSREVVRSSTSISVVDTGNGKPVWRAPVNTPTEPIVAGGWILVGTADGQLLRIDPKTGDVSERWNAGAAVLAEPVVDRGWIYATTSDGVVGMNTREASLTGWSQWGGNAQRSKAVISHWSAPYEPPLLPPPTPVSTVAAIDTPPELQYLAPDPSPTPP